MPASVIQGTIQPEDLLEANTIPLKEEVDELEAKFFTLEFQQSIDCTNQQLKRFEFVKGD